MNTFKVRGIVIKTLDIGEANKLVTLLVKESGKLYVSARGARKPKSKFLTCTQLFAYADYVIYEGKGFYSISQADIIESFHGISGEYERLCYGQYILELCDRTILPGQQCDDILRLVLKALHVTARGKISPALAARIFELKFLEFSGLAPETACCVSCGRDLLEEEQIFFNHEGVICAECSGTVSSIKLSATAFFVIRYILTADFDMLFKFRVSDTVLRELRHVSEMYMRANYEVGFKSLELLDR